MNRESPRRSGILLNLSSLPGPGPVGSMGAQAREFVDFLHDAGQTYWQVLPLTPPARGDSPYSSLSVFAGNPYYISIQELERKGLLPPGSLDSLPAPPTSDAADFNACRDRIPRLLRLAYKNGFHSLREQVSRFREPRAFWLEDFALFMALRDYFCGTPCGLWPRSLALREPDALSLMRERLRDDIDYHVFVQYIFFEQWAELRGYADSRGVKIIGDMPIYVDRESSDVWTHGDLFMLDENNAPALVAGVPPDYFSDKGQLWGNPLYNWDAMRSQGFRWWIERLRTAMDMYDTVRIDHFRGLSSYWAIPAEAGSAVNGHWLPGPGMEFFNSIYNALPHCSLIAEDLGSLDDGVRELLRQSGLPGLAVLLFAFNPWDSSTYLPHSLSRNCVAYIGTHDNDTAMGWIKSAPPEQLDFARDYMLLTPEEGENWGFIRTLLGSPANTAIIQMQDLLGLDNRARMNIPSKAYGNWTWRLRDGELSADVSARLRRLTHLYRRLP